MSTEAQQPTDAEGRTSVLLEISNAMVRLYKEQFGRGPTKARATWCTPDVVAVFLEDTLAPVERSMVRMGEHQRLREMRMMFQYATVRGFCEPVEQITGRRVRSFLSSIDTEVEGLSMETFILHPEGYDGPSRIERAER
ncbi:MAG TPA: Na-translocating system protein MpsC family protein [Baekduia sp.]|nr:Na-translocating system protein MpsC family protein [Baekduia sp.]